MTATTDHAPREGGVAPAYANDLARMKGLPTPPWARNTMEWSFDSDGTATRFLYGSEVAIPAAPSTIGGVTQSRSEFRVMLQRYEEVDLGSDAPARVEEVVIVDEVGDATEALTADGARALAQALLNAADTLTAGAER